MNKHEYENGRETKSNEIQKCQESTTLHFPSYDSREEAGGKDYKCSISSKRLFLECSLHGHAKRGSLHVKRVIFLKVSMRHLIESNDQNSFFIISKIYFQGFRSIIISNN